MVPRTTNLMDLAGFLRTSIHATLEDMDEAIAQGAAESAGLGR
jgi:hypothetical protein